MLGTPCPLVRTHCAVARMIQFSCAKDLSFGSFEGGGREMNQTPLPTVSIPPANKHASVPWTNTRYFFPDGLKSPSTGLQLAQSLNRVGCLPLPPTGRPRTDLMVEATYTEKMKYVPEPTLRCAPIKASRATEEEREVRKML